MADKSKRTTYVKDPTNLLDVQIVEIIDRCIPEVYFLSACLPEGWRFRYLCRKSLETDHAIDVRLVAIRRDVTKNCFVRIAMDKFNDVNIVKVTPSVMGRPEMSDWCDDFIVPINGVLNLLRGYGFFRSSPTEYPVNKRFRDTMDNPKKWYVIHKTYKEA